MNRRKSKGRIFNGHPAKANEWPWMAQIVISFGWLGNLNLGYTNIGCGGSLVSDRFVITAAHCLERSDLATTYGTNYKEKLRVRLADHIESKKSNKERIYNIEDMKIHENYDNETLDNDIAIIKLATQVKFNKYVSPICLPFEGQDFTGRIATAIGWGILHHQGLKGSDILMEVKVSVWDISRCKAVYGRDMTDRMMCAGTEGKGTCEGDSGGPLNCQVPATGQWYLCGIVSWGNHRCDKTEGGIFHPGLFVNVEKFVPWIEKQMKKMDAI